MPLTVSAVLLGNGVLAARPEAVKDEERNIWEENTIWIEDSPKGGLVLRFGVFGRLVEVSPGNLDLLYAPAAWKPQAAGRPTVLELKKAADHFLIQGASAANSVQAEDLSVMARHDEGGGYLARKPVLHARWQAPGRQDLVPRLTLDIVPTGSPGEYRALFRGRPLAGAKVLASGPGFVARELVTGAEGLAHLASPGPGLYQLVCSHTEVSPVYVLGVVYKGTRHLSTTTWRQP